MFCFETTRLYLTRPRHCSSKSRKQKGNSVSKVRKLAGSMVANSGAASKQKKKIKPPVKKSRSKLKKKLGPPGKRVKTQLKKPVSKSNNTTPSVNGKSCHQCQHPSNNCAEVWCTDQTKDKACTVMYCERCLRNRYGEEAEEVANLADWSCPKCRGICNCSICMKRRGLQPTGKLFGTKKATGYSSVSAILIREEKVVPDMVTTPKEVTRSKMYGSKSNNTTPSSNGKHCHQCQHPSNNCAEVWCTDQTNNKACTVMYCERCLRNRYGEMAEEVASLPDWRCPKCRGICNCSICMKRRGLQPTGRFFGTKKAAGYSSVSAMLIRERKVVSDVVTTPKQELTRVAGIDVPSEHVGNALQFLEFCSVFGKILDVKKGEPEYVLQNLLEGETGRRGKLSATAQFLIHLLSLIQNERGEISAELNPSYRKNSWFNVLKKCLSESQRVLKAQGLEDSLDVETDYETLAASEKLKFLILLCDEILGTEKVRNWLGDQKASEAKQKLLAAKDKEKSLKDDIDKAINDRNQISETSLVEPVFIGRGGEVYWKLNAFGKSDVFCQNVGKGDTLSLNEKWSSIDDEGKEAIEKYICSSRG